MSRGDINNIDSLNEAYEALSDAGHPYLEVLKEVLRLALIGGTLEPNVPVLSRICRVTPQPCGGQDVKVDSVVLSDLIGALYLNPDTRPDLLTYKQLQRTLANITWNPEDLTRNGWAALKLTCAQMDTEIGELERRARNNPHGSV